MATGKFIPTCDYLEAVEVAVATGIFDDRCPFEAPAARRAWITNEAKIALARFGDIWPQEIYGACVIAELEEVESSTEL